VQVLWKLQKGEMLDAVDNRLWLVSWLEADPLALLKTGNVICVVNHGGSSSLHQALS